MAAGIAQRAPDPYFGLNDRDIAQLGLEEGALVGFMRHAAAYQLPVRRMPSLPHGIAGLPAGLPATLGLQPPFRVQLSPGHKDPAG
jgi:NADH-quinone oxidoreductase subunit G